MVTSLENAHAPISRYSANGPSNYGSQVREWDIQITWLETRPLLDGILDKAVQIIDYSLDFIVKALYHSYTYL